MQSVSELRPSERAEFIRNTYAHLAGAVAGFITLEMLFFTTGMAESVSRAMLSSRFGWLAIIGGFALLGWMAREMTAKASEQTQYAGLAIYVVAEAIIFMPLLWLASRIGTTVIPTAAMLTIGLFAGLTAIVFTTKKDFSFLGGILKIAGCVAFGLIISSILFGFQLGMIFSAAMVIFASAAILYDTSKVMHNYEKHQYVAASLELFASVALLFWYVLRIVMELTGRD
jgi:uncharacterized protein